MDKLYDWSGFYNALCEYGPGLLLGIDEDLREIIAVSSSTTDMFWSTGLQECLAEGATAGSLREGVLAAIDQWRINIIDALDASFGITLDPPSVTVHSTSPVIDRLIDAASRG